MDLKMNLSCCYFYLYLLRAWVESMSFYAQLYNVVGIHPGYLHARSNHGQLNVIPKQFLPIYNQALLNVGSKVIPSA